MMNSTPRKKLPARKLSTKQLAGLKLNNYKKSYKVKPEECFKYDYLPPDSYAGF